MKRTKTPYKDLDQTQDIIKGFMKTKESLINNSSSRGNGFNITIKYTRLMDKFISDIFYAFYPEKDLNKVNHEHFAVFALGSYGRRELCLCSDVDLLLVHRGSLSKDVGRTFSEMLYPLWDAKLEVGQSVLTFQECSRLALNDFRFFTSIIDARFVLGSNPFSHLFLEAFWSKIHREKHTFLKHFLIYLHKRDEKYGEQGYFVEPDIKEGLGGLRDIHFIQWLARVCFSIDKLSDISKYEEFNHFEIDKLNRSRRFLLNVRNHLHLLTGRKEDRLMLSFQKNLSHSLGFYDDHNLSSSGKFMRNYYKHMNRIQWSHSEFTTKVMDIMDPRPVDSYIENLPNEFQILKGNIVLKKGFDIQADPLIILRAFNEANQRELFLGSGFIWEARKIITTMGRELCSLPNANEYFLGLILNPINSKILRLALEIGLINVFIPEFKKIRNMAQFSYYHTSTVDIHALKTLSVLYEFANGSFNNKQPIFNKVFEDLDNPDWIYLAGLLHDIGKGYKGDHSKKGSTLIPRILGRLNLEGDAKKHIAFLVNNHLLMVNISQRRDLNEEKTSVQAARSIGDLESLRQLFLLTAADSIATGPMASNDWKISLLIELFLKVRNILERGTLVSPFATKRVKRNKKKLLNELSRDYEKSKIEDLIEQVSTRYYISTGYDTISRHFQMALELGNKSFSWFLKRRKEAPVTEVNLCTHDQPGLFSKMVGVFTLNNIKVLSAKIFTLKNGLAFDTYDVTNPVDPFHEEQQWQKIKEDVMLSLDSRISLDDMINKKRRKILDGKGRVFEQRAVINVDNEASDFFTLIEVSGPERIGLLYGLAKKIHTLELDIRFAKVNTDETRMSGVFYIRDINGQKIFDESMIQIIKNEIRTIILS